MPFEPVDESESGAWEPCTSPEHDPPMMIVIRKPVWWVCPKCGARTLMRPNTIRWVVGDRATRKYNPTRFGLVGTGVVEAAGDYFVTYRDDGGAEILCAPSALVPAADCPGGK